MIGMRFRTVYGGLILAGIAGLILLDQFLFSQSRPLGSFLLTLLAALAWGEFARMSGIRGAGSKASRALDSLGLSAVVYFFVVAFLSERGLLSRGGDLWPILGIMLLILLAFTIVLIRSEFERYYISLLETVMAAVVLGLLFSYVLRIYHLPGWKGPVLGAIFLGGVKGNDTAAYYVGKAWGRRHILKVSPRKTLEGCLGAVFFSSVYFVIAAGVVEWLRPKSLFPWWGGMLFGMMISLVSQIGDLAESLIKRVYQVKDSGSLLPEFGGVLDMIDSLLFTGFFFWAGVQMARQGG